MVSPGKVALRAADEAIANIGVHESGGNNMGKYIAIYQAATIPPIGSGEAWCAAFVSYRIQNAAKDLKTKVPDWFPLSGWTPDYKKKAVKNNCWISVSDAKTNYKLVKRGDLVCFYSSVKGRIFHIGIVIRVTMDGVTTVEGNTKNESGVNPDGDGVYERHRSWKDIGSKGGFVRVPF